VVIPKSYCLSVLWLNKMAIGILRVFLPLILYLLPQKPQFLMKPLRKKTLAFISYLTIFGWLIAFFYYKKRNKSALVKFHLKQSFGLLILTIFSNVFVFLLTFLVQSLELELMLLINNMIILVLCIAGIINAAYGVRLVLPLIGTYFENKFNFIDNKR
jgi:uncharacterized membrane protein